MTIEIIGIYELVVLSIALLIYHKIKMANKEELENSVIDCMKQIAESMKAGNSFETAMKIQVDNGKGSCVKFFKKVLDKTQKGKTTEQALTETANEEKDEILRYVSEVIVLTLSSKGNVIGSITNLSHKLWEINHLQKRVDQKASAALTTLQIAAIVIVPAIFYFLAAILTSETAPLSVDFPMKVYFGIIMIIFSFLDYFIFRDLKESLYILPAGIGVYLLYIFVVGDLIAKFIII